jgi:hypothetical protein
MPCNTPAPYLTSHFYPGRPQLPRRAPSGLSDDLRAVAADIQCERYREAAWRLADRCGDDPQLVVVAAECLLLADDPAAAQNLLARHLPPDGNWALACAMVQQRDLEGALVPLASLDRLGRLQGERRTAAALLVADLDQAAHRNGLSDLRLSSEELAAARRTGYRWFVERAVRDIERAEDAASVGRIVERVETRCGCIPDPEAWTVLMPVYEAAVRATADCEMASRALDRVLRHPALLGSDDLAYSRALLFATTSVRLHELDEVLRDAGDSTSEPQSRHARWLAAAKLALVQDDADRIEADAARAIDATPSADGPERAIGLHRAGLWLTRDGAPNMSQWVLRSLHPYLPPAVAECLEDRDGRFLAALAKRARHSAAGSKAAQAAAAYLERASMIARTTRERNELHQSTGRWAYHTAVAMLETGWEAPVEPAAYAEAARRLLGPTPPGEVVDMLARALGFAYSGTPDREKVRGNLDIVTRPLVEGTAAASALMQRVLAEWERWRREGRAAPIESIEDVSASLQPVATEPGRPPMLVTGWLAELDAPDDVRELIAACFADRVVLLPDVAPFRGRRWFGSDLAHRHYQAGRTEKDPLESFRAFETAWMVEPNGIATTQGLIHGMRKRVREQRSRMHALERRAQILDHRVEREVEAALAWRTLATLVERESPEWRAHIARAAAALRRGAFRRPWTRARNAEIALDLELGDATAAGDAAWAEARLWLPGTERSRRYALLAATLWESARAPGQPQPENPRVAEAMDRSRRPPTTNREAVRYVMATGWLDALATVELDDGSLDELWRSCRGDEDRLRRSLDRQARDEVHPKNAYLVYLDTKRDTADQLEPSWLSPQSPDGPLDAEAPHLADLRLATAELLAHDVVQELSTPPAYLSHVAVRRFHAALRASTARDRTAYEKFSAKVEDALDALFDLRDAVPVPHVEPYGGRLARARAAVFDAAESALAFASPGVARCTDIVSRHLATGLDVPTIKDYVREKRMRLVPSRLGLRLGEWYAALRRVSGSQDFFHQHQHYRYQGDTDPADWLRYHHVLGSPVGDVLHGLLESLELHARHIAVIQAEYRGSRTSPQVGLRDFGLDKALRDGLEVLRRVLSADPTRDDLRAIEGSLRALSNSLRSLDLARLARTNGLLMQHGLPEGRYLIPRGPELLSHWRNNVGDHPTLRANFEVRDDADRDILCALCLDEEPTPAPARTALRGLAPHADMVEALGGQLHLWMARPGQRSGCRRDHRECAAEDYVVRIEQRLRELSANQWLSEQATVEKWLRTIQRALHGQQSATLSFVVLPRLHEVVA